MRESSPEKNITVGGGFKIPHWRVKGEGPLD